MTDWIHGPWVAPLAALLAALVLGVLFRVIVLRRAARFFARTETDIDDLIFESIRGQVPFWFLLGGAVVAAHLAPVSQPTVGLVLRSAAVLLILSLSLAASSFATNFLQRRAARTQGGAAATSLSVNVVRAAILGLGGLLVLSNLGISITPLLTALGVGSLAVALALQPTLTNFFAGIHISVAKPIRVGDFVELETGTQGYVADIGWRATRIRELPNNIIVVPNSRLSDMILKNYAMPVPEQAALVQVGVAYGSDLQKVERVTCDVAHDTLTSVQGGVGEFDPFIRYHTFGDSSINFTVILRVKEFTDRYLVTHEFVKRLKQRYDQEGIEIPFPQRVVHAPSSQAFEPVARGIRLAGPAEQVP